MYFKGTPLRSGQMVHINSKFPKIYTFLLLTFLGIKIYIVVPFNQVDLLFGNLFKPSNLSVDLGEALQKK